MHSGTVFSGKSVKTEKDTGCWDSLKDYTGTQTIVFGRGSGVLFSKEDRYSSLFFIIGVGIASGRSLNNLNKFPLSSSL